MSFGEPLLASVGPFSNMYLWGIIIQSGYFEVFHWCIFSFFANILHFEGRSCIRMGFLIAEENIKMEKETTQSIRSERNMNNEHPSCVLNIYISCYIAPHCNLAVDENG